jgi:hypothetical protein
MRTALKLTVVLAVGLTTAVLVIRPPRSQLSSDASQPLAKPIAPIEEPPQTLTSPVPNRLLPFDEPNVLPEFTANSELDQPVTNKLERLRQTRETFTALAGGDPATALRAAKQLTDENERETALLTLLTEWTHGELGPAQRRARLIAQYGMEAGLAIELAAKPELAMLWADELAVGPARVAVYENAAVTMLNTDPAAALALNEKLPELQRRNFLDAVYSTWASADTDAALNWADQISDPAEKDVALAAIRTAAPVGIGAVLNMVDGYAVVNGLVPESPAQLSGQLHPGDRIVALAQGDNSFVDAHSLPLEKIVQIVRGAPNTLLQLQVLPANAQPGAAPTTVALYRNQVKFKR